MRFLSRFLTWLRRLVRRDAPADQQQPPTRPIPRADEYEPAGPDDADHGPVPEDEPDQEEPV